MTEQEQVSLREYLRARTDAETARLKALRTIRAHGELIAEQMTAALADELPEGARVVWDER